MYFNRTKRSADQPRGIAEKAFAIAIQIMMLAVLLAGCSQTASLKDAFGYQTPFQIGDVKYTIDSIAPAESDYADYGLHNGVMTLNITCEAMKDGAEPNLENRLTMYDSNGRENSDVLLTEGGGESGIKKMKAGATNTYKIAFAYDYEEPWYELQISDEGSSKTVTSFKFSIDPGTLEVSLLE